MIYVPDKYHEYTGRRDGHAGLSCWQPVLDNAGDREVSRAELSPDGSQFVMRLIKKTQDDIATVSRDGKEWRDITNDEPFDRYVRWSADGKRIAFSSDREGGAEVWLCNLDGSGMMQFTDDGDKT